MNERFRVMERATASYQTLADLAETVEDEWQYVTDLTEAYLPAIQALGRADSGRPLTSAQVIAVDEAVAEIGLITDPHKAIDWLSTFPHVVALAVGGTVDESAAGEVASRGRESDAPDDALPDDALPDDASPDDALPFRILLGGDQ